MKSADFGILIVLKGAVDFEVLGFLAEFVAAVVLFFCAADGDGDFDAIVGNVEVQREHGDALGVGLLNQVGNLIFVEEQAAFLFGFVAFLVGVFVRGDVHFADENLAFTVDVDEATFQASVAHS